MQIIEESKTKTIIFRGAKFFISEDDLDHMVHMREERKRSGHFFIPDGTNIQDYFASNGIFLEDGGEICPIEMGVLLGPTSAGGRLLADKFGDDWHTYDNWTPNS